MNASERSNNAKDTGRVSWQAVLFAAFGAIVGSGYSIAICRYVGFSPLTCWVLILIGAGLIGMIGLGVGRSGEYSVAQKVLLLPLVPPVFLVSATTFLGIILTMLFLFPVFAIQRIRGEHKFRTEMKAAGRYVRWSDLLPLLESGQGTLIEESSTSGPFRIWYTPDDLLAKGEPISTDKELIGVFFGKLSHLFNSRCLHEYLDPNSGTALATSIRPRFVKTDRFKKRFPHVTVVRLIRPVVPSHEIGVDQP